METVAQQQDRARKHLVIAFEILFGSPRGDETHSLDVAFIGQFAAVATVSVEQFLQPLTAGRNHRGIDDVEFGEMPQ